MKFVDKTGNVYGKLKVVSLESRLKKGNKITWNCECECGNKCVVVGTYLGVRTNSCGCMSSRKTASERNSTHKLSKTRMYSIYKAMMYRCYEETNKFYKNYGGRGISVCERWHDVNNFFEDMKDSYKDGLSIERINVNGNYCKDNCKWITRSSQADNKRNSRRFLEYPDKTLKDLCKEHEMEYQTVLLRINRYGMNIVDALNTPPKVKRK